MKLNERFHSALRIGSSVYPSVAGGTGAQVGVHPAKGIPVFVCNAGRSTMESGHQSGTLLSASDRRTFKYTGVYKVGVMWPACAPIRKRARFGLCLRVLSPMPRGKEISSSAVPASVSSRGQYVYHPKSNPILPGPSPTRAFMAMQLADMGMKVGTPVRFRKKSAVYFRGGRALSGTLLLSVR